MSETQDFEDLPPEKLPLDQWHRDHGARMVPFAGYEMPIQYEGIKAEHEWTRSKAGLFDVSHMGQLIVSGDGAGAALEAILPASLASLKPGHIRYSLLLNESGGILDDLMVTNSSRDGVEAFTLVVNGAMKWDDIGWLREHLPDDITMNHLADSALLALQGPEAAAALERVIPGCTDDLYFMQSTQAEWNGVEVGIARSGYTGEDGFEISLPASHAAKLADALLEIDSVKPAGLGARDSLRLEAGLPLYGHDLTEETDPVSAGLGFALTKSRRESGGFIGHDACMARLAMDGSAQVRVGLTLEGRLPAREGATVHCGDAMIGTVTSGGFSPTLGHPIAMAYIDSEHAEIGTQLSIEVRGRSLPATVTSLPFVPHNYARKGA
ncbi:glycine cleavage system aminomethyltransferase GcvT [Aurantiacibacter rhizosphaerae]|uniref:aminomethyltransferase n=1 Tax=Aurantiacibacter rhizosphaerae TaxID=2691582 RepID=A0A844XH88_9SPHN|nr:glycine cleavage system aminomethyltransferase GcvT [Aurantiacibacter rhizosphaerae]MWV29042.1 glycine cleavage system aminomethyltransferase GcvT [Aurantiacibacter rhizosphaerae]